MFSRYHNSLITNNTQTYQIFMLFPDLKGEQTGTYIRKFTGNGDGHWFCKLHIAKY